MNQIMGIILLVIGVVLLFFAFQSANAPVDQVANALTGRFTSTTILYLVLGLVGVVGGALLTFRRPGTPA